MTRAFVFCLACFGLAGCSSAESSPYGKSGDSKASAPSGEATPKAQVAAKTPAAVKGAGAEQDGEGCIYAEGEKDESQHECPHGDEANGALANQDKGHFGEPFALASAVPLTKAVGDSPKGPIQVKGEVEAVCQKKGCWMVIKDGTTKARVLMKNHGFTVPMDSRGKSAVIEGELESRTFSEAQVKHLEKDAGKDPAKVSGTRTEHVLKATGVQINS